MSDASLTLFTFAHDGQSLAPHDLWSAWSFEPAVLILLALAAGAYVRGLVALWRSAGAGAGIRRGEAAAFAAGWLVLLLSLVSPLHRLGSVLFSAHMVQHELLMVVAAPLLILGRPLIPFVWALPMSWRRRVGDWAALSPLRRTWEAVTLPITAWILHGLAIWLWHAPPLFEATLRSEAIHTLQHTSFLGTALLFWWAILRGREGRLGRPAAVLYLFTTSVHTTVLGALLTFSTVVWYPVYGSTNLWGLSPLEDQQLAGLVMWVPANLGYWIASLAIATSWLKQADTTKPARKVGVGALLLAGCAGSPKEAARKLQQTQASWEATVRLSGELRQRNMVPERYARQTIDVAKEELETIGRKREQLPR
jgi:putative membrane protein